MGQVFLKTSWPCDRVAEQAKNWHATRVLEIGPGGGILTRTLLANGFKVTAVEKDDRFAERLDDYRKTLPEEDGKALTIVNQDVLRFSLGDWLAESREPCAVVGNIPYNISSPILMWLIPHMSSVVGAMFLVQLEFALRLVASPPSKSYGSLSVFTQLRTRVALDCKVPRNCFQPIPRVDSALVSLTSGAKSLPTPALMRVEHIARLAFQQRRKKMSNAVSTLLEKLGGVACPIDLNRRPDSLSPDEYCQLARYFYPEDFK